MKKRGSSIFCICRKWTTVINRIFYTFILFKSLRVRVNHVQRRSYIMWVGCWDHNCSARFNGLRCTSNTLLIKQELRIWKLHRTIFKIMNLKGPRLFECQYLGNFYLTCGFIILPLTWKMFATLKCCITQAYPPVIRFRAVLPTNNIGLKSRGIRHISSSSDMTRRSN